MFIAADHPKLAPDTSGKARRYVTGTRLIRPVRFDGESDRVLNRLRYFLHMPNDGKDLASVSMVCRRAVRLYYGNLLKVVHDPGLLEAERQAVRALTKPPGRKRKPSRNPARSVLRDANNLVTN